MATGDRFDVVCPVERGEGDKKKTFWFRCGSAWEKGEGRFSIVLDTLPTNGRLMLMPPKEDANSSKGKSRGAQEDIRF